MVKWRDVIELAEEEARKYHETYGLPLTVRGLFYILVGKNIVPNTKNTYIEFSRHLARARYLGEFPWYLIQDDKREISWGDLGYTVEDAQRVVEELSRLELTPEEKERIVKEYLKSKYRVRLLQWEGQPKRVMAVVEKDTLYRPFKALLRERLGWDVALTSTRGFESASHAHEIATWIKGLRKRGMVPVLLLFYDFDPSGEYASMRDFIFRVLLLASDEDAERSLAAWERGDDNAKKAMIEELSDKLGLAFEKVMLTWDQIVKYDVPPRPEAADALRKLQRDPRKQWFVERYGELYQAEVDAMLSLHPGEAIRIIDEAIRKHFDSKAYEEVKRKEEELKKKVDELLE